MMHSVSLPRRTCPPFAILGFAAGILLSPQIQAVQFDISSIPGSTINFDGNGTLANVTFSVGSNFQIDNVIGGAGTAAGYQGTFSGTWTLGPVTTVTVVPLQETAPVTGVGALSISDGTDTLTANIAWVQATSLKTIISIGTLGFTGNVTSLSYSGSDPDLLAFATGLDQTGLLAYSFPPPGVSLAQLVSVGRRDTSFSGSLV